MNGRDVILQFHLKEIQKYIILIQYWFLNVRLLTGNHTNTNGSTLPIIPQLSSNLMV